MNYFEWFTKVFRRFLPSTFTIAILLTIVTFIGAWIFTGENNSEHVWLLLEFWQKGLWTPSLLVFAVQMMLMLVLGHVLALTPFFEGVIGRLTSHCTNTSRAAMIVVLFTCLMAYFNWGLGLIFGAILARKIGEFARERQIKINYPLIAASGYVGLMIWHGGLSGSALIKVAENGHLKNLLPPGSTLTQKELVPDSLPQSETMFAGMNIFVMVCSLVIIPAAMYYLGTRTRKSYVRELPNLKSRSESLVKIVGAEKLDYSKWVSKSLGLLLILLAVKNTFLVSGSFSINSIDPNSLNFLLLSLCLLFHKNIKTFLLAVDEAIIGASGILIQFPLYFGIMGIMRESGLVNIISHQIIEMSSVGSFPIYTFLSAAFVNIFIPSGGGQWLIQGPIIVESALRLGVSLPKCILAFAYGDGLTNMIQPFWAIPLLGITGLNAREILPYTLYLFFIGTIIFMSAILMF